MKITRSAMAMAFVLVTTAIANAGDLHVYPGATPTTMMAVIGPMPHCGHTMISLVTYDPPVPSSGMALMRQAAAGNQAAMAKAGQGCGVL